VSLLAEDGSHSLGADITTGYPEFDHVLLKKLGWWDELTDAEKKAGRGQELEDRPLGRHHPRGHEEPRLPPLRQRQGARRGVELPRCRFRSTASRCTAPARPGGQVPDTHDDKKAFWRLPTLYKTPAGQEQVADKVYEKFPLIMTSGRLVEYEGAARKPAPTPGWPSCSRRCSSRSTPRRLPTAAFATASACG
jgi:formate dehydrogenase major subunit